MKLAVLACLLVIIPFQAVAGSCVGKKVDVWVANGNGLTGDGLLSPDPYVVVKISGYTKRSEVINGNFNPGWWEKLHFPRANNNAMRIEVWEADKGIRRGDDHLGTCDVQMVSEGEEYRSIKCKTEDDGFVKLFYKCF